MLWLLLLGTGILLVLSAQDNIRPYRDDSNYNYGYHYNNGYGSVYGYGPSDYVESESWNHRQGIVEAVGSGFAFVVTSVMPKFRLGAKSRVLT